MVAPPDLAGVTVVQQAGAGEAITAKGSYPLGTLALTHTLSGRGVLTLKAGVGALQLSGDQADEVTPGHWHLQIDRAALLNAEAARGECDLVRRTSPPGYASLSCSVTFAGDAGPITVRWRGDGSPAVRVR